MAPNWNRAARRDVQEGNVEHHHFVIFPQHPGPLDHLPTDLRMGEPVEIGQGFGRGKDRGRQGRPVDLAVLLDDAGTEAIDDRLKGGSARLEDLPRDHVGVDHGGASGGQGCGHRRFAGADAAGEAHGEHGANVAAHR